MIHATNFRFGVQSGFKNRMWLSIAISLFSSAASAQSYPISGVWVAKDDGFPGSTAVACFVLKKFGIDAVSAQPFPTLMIFSESKRFEVRGNYIAQRTVKSVKGASDGGFQITEAGGKRWPPWSKKRLFKLKIINPATIEITKDNVSTRFFKCSNSPSL
jgi:hypothetical protein